MLSDRLAIAAASLLEAAELSGTGQGCEKGFAGLQKDRSHGFPELLPLNGRE